MSGINSVKNLQILNFSKKKQIKKLKNSKKSAPGSPLIHTYYSLPHARQECQECCYGEMVYGALHFPRRIGMRSNFKISILTRSSRTLKLVT